MDEDHNIQGNDIDKSEDAGTTDSDKGDDIDKSEFRRYASKRMVVGVLLAVVALWVVGTVLGFFEKSPSTKIARISDETASIEQAGQKTAVGTGLKEDVEAQHAVELPQLPKPEPEHGVVLKPVQKPSATLPEAGTAKKAAGHGTAAKTAAGHSSAAKAIAKSSAEPKTMTAAEHAAGVKPAVGAGAASHGVSTPVSVVPKPKGVAFVEAIIKPLHYELYERFWGWRPNDILDFTDNVNNFQLGVLEVTRRTSVALTERISRTGSTASFDENLERAMNWFMIKADRYWFPSPESKYKAGLEELEEYKAKLEKGAANFHTRTDNLIPLLMAYEDLLGSCEENLVKLAETGGGPVSYFKSDDYFFYAQGVASAMGTILEAVLEDFLITVESRRGLEVLHNVIESCHHATEIHPWLITNSSLSGVLANHRANLAAPMSHARFFIGVLIKALST